MKDKTIEEMLEETLKQMDEGYTKWRIFCALMEKYPNASYAEILIRTKEHYDLHKNQRNP